MIGKNDRSPLTDRSGNEGLSFFFLFFLSGTISGTTVSELPDTSCTVFSGFPNGHVKGTYPLNMIKALSNHVIKAFKNILIDEASLGFVDIPIIRDVPVMLIVREQMGGQF